MWKKVSFLVTYYLTPNKNLPNNDLHFLFDNLGITPFIIVRHLTPFCSASFHLRLSFRLCLSSQWWEPPDSIMHTGLLPLKITRSAEPYLQMCLSPTFSGSGNSLFNRTSLFVWKCFHVRLMYASISFMSCVMISLGTVVSIFLSDVDLTEGHALCALQYSIIHYRTSTVHDST